MASCSSRLAAEPVRRRVLISAYACRPGHGSESGAGWAWAWEAAREYDVLLVTRSRNVPLIQEFLRANDGSGRRIKLVGIEAGQFAKWAKNAPLGTYLYYAIWQHMLASRINSLCRDFKPEILHHVTFASDWLPTSLRAASGPVTVWGPVGGYEPVRPILRRHLRPLGRMRDQLRWWVTQVPRARIGVRQLCAVDVLVAQNQVVGDWARARRKTCKTTTSIIVDPGVLLEDCSNHRAAREEYLASRRATCTASTVGSMPLRAVWGGRILGWKGWRLAIDALDKTAQSDWRMDVFGTGPGLGAMKRRVRQLGIEQRVRFWGPVTRATFQSELALADAYLSTSIHEAAGWAVAEAATLGVPVVAIPAAGPSQLATSCPSIALVDTEHGPVQGIADVLDRLAEEIRSGKSTSPCDAWIADLSSDRVRGVYELARTQSM